MEVLHLFASRSGLNSYIRDLEKYVPEGAFDRQNLRHSLPGGRVLHLVQWWDSSTLYSLKGFYFSEVFFHGNFPPELEARIKRFFDV